jgi:hypothetical protein
MELAESSMDVLTPDGRAALKRMFQQGALIL